MKHPLALTIICTTAALLTLSSPALALNVSNLDNVPHTVIYEAAGSHFEQTAQPQETIRFPGLADGKLSLKTENPKPSRGNIHADGMLSGVVGGERDQQIPTDDRDTYAIWPGGELLLQSHQRDQSRH